MRVSKPGIWIISLLLGLGSLQAQAHKSGHSSDPGERSRHVADYDEDDDEPIYWEHDDETGGPWEEVLISKREAQVIRDFYKSWHPGAHAQRQPPPYLKEEVWMGGDLPPDWRQRVRKLRVIPTDIYAGAYLIPKELLHKLPPQPEGTWLIEIGNRVVRTYNESRMVADFVDL